ncbi:MAG: hypothetical protein LBL06_03615 [Treponema sp.]|jgi:hypothetical protein|nr:hypothetical protein [Treponema sp.]
MKHSHVFIAIVAVALSVSCASMQKIKPEEGNYSETVQVPRMNAADLFKTINLWLTNRFAEQQRGYQSGELTIFDDQPIQTLTISEGISGKMVSVRDYFIIPPSVIDTANEAQGVIGGEYTYVYKEVVIKNSGEILRCLSANFTITVSDEEYTISFSNPYHRKHASFNRNNTKLGKPITIVTSARDGTLADGFYRPYLEPTKAEWEALSTSLKNFVIGN